MAEWLGDVIVRAQRQADDDVRLLRLGRQHDDRNGLGSAVAFESAGHLGAIDATEASDRERSGREARATRLRLLLAAVRDRHVVAIALKVVGMRSTRSSRHRRRGYACGPCGRPASFRGMDRPDAAWFLTLRR